MANFQTIFRFLVPSWLSRDEGEKVLGSLALLKDIATERVLAGLQARFPSRAGPSALALIGQDRGIIQGRTEADASYAARLIGWRWPRGHRTRGSAFALLQQVVAFWGADIAYADIVDIRGTLHLNVAGVESYAYGVYSPKFNWDGASISPNWGRFWVGIRTSAISTLKAWGNFGDAALWGGFLNQDHCIGLDGCTPSDWRSMVRLFIKRAWKPAGTRAEWFIVALDDSGPDPDGTYGRWSKNVSGTQTATRYANWRFVALNDVVNVYAGDLTNYPTTSQYTGGTYSGNSANFPASSTLPDGTTYAGNGATFPASASLPDDGSPAL